MGKNSSIEIRGHQLAEKLGIKLSEYHELPQAGHGLYQPKELMGEDSKKRLWIVKQDFEQLEKTKDSKFNTGEIWYDNAYETFYLILGKVSTEELVLVLGGDTPYAGSIEKGIINSGTGPNIFCDRLVFKPKS